jgi:hypothetical protein
MRVLLVGACTRCYMCAHIRPQFVNERIKLQMLFLMYACARAWLIGLVQVHVLACLRALRVGVGNCVHMRAPSCVFFCIHTSLVLRALLGVCMPVTVHLYILVVVSHAVVVCAFKPLLRMRARSKVLRVLLIDACVRC